MLGWAQEASFNRNSLTEKGHILVAVARQLRSQVQNDEGRTCDGNVPKNNAAPCAVGSAQLGSVCLSQPSWSHSLVSDERPEMSCRQSDNGSSSSIFNKGWN